MNKPIQPAIDRDSKRLMLLVLLPVTLLFIILGYVLQQQRQAQQLEDFDQDQIRALAEAQALLKTALNQSIQHLTGTVANPFVLQAMSSGNPTERSRALAASLSGVALRNRDYMQLRWILPSGQEALRIDVDHENGGIYNRPQEELQNKANRPYHGIIMQLQALEVGITDADLNVEDGRIEVPLNPTIRYGLRLPQVNDVDLGYLIFNLDLDQLLDTIRRLQGDTRLFLADASGQWILHDQSEWAWGLLLGNDTQISQTNPELWAALNNNTLSNNVLNTTSGRWRWTKIRVGQGNESVAVSPDIWMLANIPRATLANATSGNIRQSLLLYATLLVALLIFSAVLYSTQKRATLLRRENQGIAQELNSSLTFQQTLNNVLPALVVYWNREEKCEYVNETSERWFNTPASELIGKTFSEVMLNEDHQLYHSLLMRALAGEKVTFERSVINNNITQHLHTTYVPHQQPDPLAPNQTLISGVISISTDLTEIIQARKDVEVLNQALAERTRQAETTAAAKSHFLANMSHEIRTPMNAIIGLLDIIRETELNAQQHDYIDNARASAKSLLHVLNDILDLSKLEAGKLSINLESFDVERLFNNTVKLFDSAFYKKQVELLVWVDPRIPRRLKGDPHRLNQVLNNLVGNALKFTRQGEVVLSVTLASKNEMSAHLIYSVKDTGIGIAAEKQQSIFDYFNQADNDTTREFGGSGLGLSICRTLVQLMDGSIGVSSTENNGSEFYFELDHEIVEENIAKPPRLKRILIVDSSSAARNMTKAYLDSWSITTDTAGSLEAGLAAINNPDIQYDAILLDWQLNDDSGLDLINAVRSNDQPLPLTVLMTNKDPYDLLNEIKARDISDVPLLKKPFTSSALYDVLARLDNDNNNAESNNSDNEQKRMQEQARQLVSKRILMVEDNALNQEIARTLLANLGIPLEVCDSGEAALERVRENDYDAILMDLHMPTMDGFETTRRIRELLGPSLPIIALSAAVMEDDIAQAKGAGMDDHVAKPIDLAQLVNTLYRWLPVPMDTATANHHSTNSHSETSADVPLDSLFTQMGESTAEVMRRFQNQEATVRHLLVGFARNYHDFSEQLEQAVQADDAATLKRLLHTLKGTAGSLGLSRLSDAAQALEQDLKTQWPVPLESIQQPLNQVLTALQTLTLNDLPQAAIKPEDKPALLNEVDAILSRSRVIPTELIMQLRSLAANDKLADHYQQLLEQIDRFDYANARTTLSDIKDRNDV
ncbi:response regulator [Saccharospirillum sp. HFRX-1]|uniref:hybrid sensor histidine kinase/response regulator n=1 Tax=unclassified Saccharospirillum TaxID=2633430 RepID=UPI0037167C07